MDAIENKIRLALVKQLKKSGFRFDLKNTDSLISRGIIDSLGAIELINQLEEIFKIKVLPEEMTEANFDSINKITVFISEKLK